MKYSRWAAPIIPVLKHDRKSIRICGDYKLIANKVSQVDKYLIPKIDDLLARSMNQAYQKLELSESNSDN